MRERAALQCQVPSVQMLLLDFGRSVFKEPSAAKLHISCETLASILEVTEKLKQKPDLDEAPSNVSTKWKNRKATTTWLVMKIKASFKNSAIL